jgi:uncharacterized membrane-anchored protein
MMYSIQCNSRASRRTVLLLAIITTSFCILGGPVIAQQDFLSPSPRANSPQWVVGPATAPLGDAAAITIPEGCRFTDEMGARAVLASSREPVPANLLGLLFPDSRQWFAVIQFTDIGYVNDAGKVNLDADAILKKYQTDIARQNREHAAMDPRVTIADVSWELKPLYDPVLNKLEYALKAKSAAGGSINYVADWLGRRGMLSVTIVQPEQSAFNLPALRDAVKGIAFVNGDRYEDHRQADRVARFGLADLILNSEGAEPPSRLSRLMEHRWFWPAAAGGVLIFLLVGYVSTAFIIKKRKTRYYRMDDKYQRRHVMPQPSAVANGHPVNGNGQTHAVAANGQAALPVNGGFQRNGHRRRKKRFSYHAFYSDMVMNLTRSNYAGAPHSTYAGIEPTTPSSGGFESLSGQSFGQNSSLPDATNLLVAETSKLIQSQQKLIEGQRKLIEEQSRLIQEKSMLLGAEIKPAGKQPEAEALTGQQAS